MKYLILILSVGLITSCNPLDISILEPLSLNDLKSEIKKDSSFSDFYKRIQFINDSILASDIEKVKWADLTYERFIDFMNYTRDSSITNPFYKRVDSLWKNEHGKYLNKVDSISDHWKKYQIENSINQYVKIELVELYKERYSYSGDIKTVNFGFKLSPLKGTVQQLDFSYELEPKIDEDKGESDFSYLISNNESWCSSRKPFSRPVIRYWEVGYKNKKMIKNYSLKTLLRDYNISIVLDKLRVKDNNLTDENLYIPESIKSYWKHHKGSISDYYKEEVVKELIDENFQSYYSFYGKELGIFLSKKDKLSYDYMMLEYN